MIELASRRAPGRDSGEAGMRSGIALVIGIGELEGCGEALDGMGWVASRRA